MFNINNLLFFDNIKHVIKIFLLTIKFLQISLLIF